MAEMFMIGNNGIMQPCVEHPELPKGTIIYSFGAGWIFSKKKEQEVRAKLF